ncbi:MAG: TonB-dependent receptor [Gemmatimonadota bacterium]
MRTRTSGRAARRTGALATIIAAALALLAGPAFAQQTGQITGTVTDADGQPLNNAEVRVVDSRLGTLTDADGAFTLTGVPAGTHRLAVSHVGHRADMVEQVEVRAGETSSVQVTLDVAPRQMDDLVVSATRGVQRLTDAPATIAKVGEDEIDRSIGNSFVGALKSVKGLDYIQVGVTTAQLNARGFNSSFNNRMLMIEDGRLAVLPENGLPVGTFTAIPKIDLESVEVVVGPGSALYGADASNGVINLQTKDPRDHRGTDVEIEGGTRDRFGIQARHADVVGEDERFGYKITGEWQQVQDFSNRLSFPVGDTVIPEADIDWTNEVYRGQAELGYYGDEVDLRVRGGLSATWGLGQTNVGRNQFTPWRYDFQQVELDSDHWWVNLYRTHSDPGDTYAVNRFTELRFANPDMSEEQVKDAAGWPGFGELWVAEAQGDYTVPSLLNTDVSFGGEFRHDVVSSDRRWLTDRQTGENITLDRFGGFVQTQTPLTPGLELLLAGRIDTHDDFDTQFSPKAGLILQVAENQTLRATFNRAFKSPTTLQRHFYIPDFVPLVGVMGNRNGFTVRDGDDNVVAEIDPVVPESNNTWELGYRGLIGERLILDLTGYYADYEDFLGTLRGINNPYATEVPPTFAYDHEGELVESENGPQIVLTYQNLGAAELLGLDGEVRFAVTPDVMLRGTLSVFDDLSLDEVETDPEATALNAPKVKWNLGADFEDLGGGLFAGLLLRTVNSYDYVSGINVGEIPTFNTLNVHAGYRFPGTDLEAQASVQNLFTCRTVAEDDPITPDAEPGSRECGFDEPHIEMINMPAQEATAFLTLRYSF